MSETPYDGILPPSKLDKALDEAIERANAAFLADPAAQRQAAENGERWRRITEARDAVGRHGVVLPVATAVDILAVLSGMEPQEPMTPAMLCKLVHAEIERADVAAAEES